MKTVNNPLTKILAASKFLPPKARSFVLSKAFGRMVPYVGTSRLVYDIVTPNKVQVSVANKRPIQNHIHNVHAAAMALIAETATGFITGLNMPNDRIVLIKSFTVNFKKPTKGNMCAVATLTDGQRQFILDNPKGELLIPVSVTDATKKEPIEVQMLWAWLPKSELKKRQQTA